MVHSWCKAEILWPYERQMLLHTQEGLIMSNCPAYLSIYQGTLHLRLSYNPLIQQQYTDVNRKNNKI